MISKQTHEAMSNIFKLIAHKDKGQEGIEQLYEFKVSDHSTLFNLFIQDIIKIINFYATIYFKELKQLCELANYRKDNLYVERKRSLQIWNFVYSWIVIKAHLNYVCKWTFVNVFTS